MEISFILAKRILAWNEIRVISKERVWEWRTLLWRNVLNNLFPFCVSTVICETLFEPEFRWLEGHVGVLFPTGKI